jgi:hypothetical protein
VLTVAHPLAEAPHPAVVPRLTLTYAVTFEFDTRPPLTHRGTIAASQVATCVSRAMKQAATALRPRGWRSVVCLLEKRGG